MNEDAGQYEIVWLENPRPDGSPAEAGTWTRHRIGDQQGYIKDMAFADFDGDGTLDVVIRANEQTAIHLQEDPSNWRRVRYSSGKT